MEEVNIEELSNESDNITYLKN